MNEVSIIIIILHLHSIDVTTGQLSNSCFPSNYFPRSVIFIFHNGLFTSLSITSGVYSPVVNTLKVSYPEKTRE